MAEAEGYCELATIADLLREKQEVSDNIALMHRRMNGCRALSAMRWISN